MVFPPFPFDGLSVNQQREKDSKLRADKAKEGLLEQEKKRIAKGKRAEASGLTSDNRFRAGEGASARTSGAQDEGGEKKKKEEDKNPPMKAHPPRVGAAARERLLTPTDPKSGNKPTDGLRGEKCEPNSRFMRSPDRFPGADNWGTLIPLAFPLTEGYYTS